MVLTLLIPQICPMTTPETCSPTQTLAIQRSLNQRRRQSHFLFSTHEQRWTPYPQCNLQMQTNFSSSSIHSSRGANFRNMKYPENELGVRASMQKSSQSLSPAQTRRRRQPMHCDLAPFHSCPQHLYPYPWAACYYSSTRAAVM